MKRFFTFFSIFFLSSQLWSQGYQVNVIVENLTDRWVYLSRFYKTEFNTIDSIFSVNGSFYFHLDSTGHGGLYRIELQKPDPVQQNANPDFIEFIYNNESFSISADYMDLEKTVNFGNSAENMVLNQFRSYEEGYQQKLNALNLLLDSYPGEDRFYKHSGRHYKNIQQERDSFINELFRKNSGLFAAKLIDAYRSPVIQPAISGEERTEYLKEHFFEMAPISDPDLLYAPVYNRRIIEYLMLYRVRGYTFSEQEDAFIDAVDIIMANTSGDTELRSFVVEYLLDGFQSFGMEKIQVYIVETYVDETCETDAVELARVRVEGYRKMEAGQRVEDILIRTHSDEMVRLSDVNADYILVLFWAVHCEHCRDMMPELKEWYLNERPSDMEVFAVSIDTVKSEWETYLEKNNLPWINAHEPMGWEGKSAEDYNIYATPTLFLLDKGLEIVARPFTIRELKRQVKRLER
ncbi:MAG: AhpC/TSA family protein [Bacteroidales bacterium]|nr:AhpC/TSA family protein [Bacteroidales bacterium]